MQQRKDRHAFTREAMPDSSLTDRGRERAWSRRRGRQTASDEYVFRAVPLCNVELTVPYSHSGKVWNPEQAVAIMGVAQLGKELTPQETSDIAAFLRALTGQQPRVELPLLPASTALTPRPEPLVKNSLEKGDAVEKQNSRR